MKIAAPIQSDGFIDEHFGHCEYFNIFTISEKNEVIDVQVLKPEDGCGCKSGLAPELAQLGVKVMLAGGIGGGAINVLNSVGIEVIRGCSGLANEVVKQYLAGLVADSGESCKQHEEHHGQGHHGHGHNCNHN